MQRMKFVSLMARQYMIRNYYRNLLIEAFDDSSMIVIFKNYI